MNFNINDLGKVANKILNKVEKDCKYDIKINRHGIGGYGGNSEICGFSFNVEFDEVESDEIHYENTYEYINKNWENVVTELVDYINEITRKYIELKNSNTVIDL